MNAGRTHLVVMAAPVAGIDANEYLTITEQLWPRFQRMEIVERHPDAGLGETPLVFLTRREVRREENALAIDAGQRLHHVLDLRSRHAFEVEALTLEQLQDFRVPVRLEGVE